MNIKEAVQIVKKEDLIPIHAFESPNYILFFVVDKNGEAIGNNASFVVDKRKGIGKWIPRSAFPLDDEGEIIEYDEDELV